MVALEAGRPSRLLGRSSMPSVMLVLTLMSATAGCLVVGRWYFEEQIRELRDELADVREQLLESQDRAQGLQKAARREKEGREKAEREAGELREGEALGRAEMAKQRMAVGELKAGSQAKLLACEATVREEEAKVVACAASVEREKVRYEQRIAQLIKAVSDKKLQLEAYHETIVAQRGDIDAKTQTINGLLDSLHRAEVQAQAQTEHKQASLEPPAPAA